MPIDPDAVVDRRRLKRKITLWRAGAFVAAIVAVAAVLFSADVGGRMKSGGAHVARISVSGLMVPDRAFVEMVDGLAKSEAVKGVIVDIDSPGGATTAGESVYAALRRLSEKKPTAAFVGSLGASAAYMAAIGTDHVVARGSALTGSIGVLIQWGDVSELMKTVGVKLDEVKSSPMKAEPTPFKPTSPEARAMLDRVVRDTYDWFVDLVATRRNLPRETALALADGRVVTGRQALALKLVDEIGEESAALAWVQSRGVDASLPVKTHKPKPEGSWPWLEGASEAATRGIAAALGIDRLSASIRSLDGVQSVWQAGALEKSE